jgi:hypothetical protein
VQDAGKPAGELPQSGVVSFGASAYYQQQRARGAKYTRSDEYAWVMSASTRRVRFVASLSATQPGITRDHSVEDASTPHPHGGQIHDQHREHVQSWRTLFTA